MNNKKEESLKVLIVGDSSVGKTSLLMRYCEDKFHTDFLSTIGVDFKVKKIQTSTHNISMNIWDTAGQERFRNITKTFYKGAHGVILVYSITDERSFSHVQSWIQQVKDNGSSTAQILLVASKADLEKQRRVSKKEGKNIAQKFNINYIETSSKENHNISKVFEQLAEQIVQKLQHEKQQNNTKQSNEKGEKITNKKQKKIKKQGCC